ncbi:DUF1232 domain-containing protein [soil metagenome]
MRDWARRLKGDVAALALAIKDPRTPWYAKAISLFVVAYALSPIDLIPDFIPILGYLDDLIILPLGIALVIRLMPDGLMEEYRQGVDATAPRRSWFGAILILAIWILCAYAVMRAYLKR